MPLSQHNLLKLLPITAALGLLTACGPRTETVAGDYGIPGFLQTPPGVSAVAPGSRQVVASPPPGGLFGTLLLSLLAEPGAKIRYAFQPFAADAAPESLTEYKQPLLLLPPVTVWAQAETEAGRGDVASFAYDYDSAFLAPIEPLVSRRLPPVGSAAPVPLSAQVASPTTLFPPDGLTTRRTVPPSFDGTSPSAVLDGTGDVPAGFAFIDLAWAEAGETDGEVAVTLGLAGKPLTQVGVVYGFEIGPSNISFATFGAGAAYVYRVELQNGALSVTQKDTGAALKLSAQSRGLAGTSVEFHLAKADLPLLDGKTDLAVRPYAEDLRTLVTGGTTVADRIEPFFLRSSFALERRPAQAGSRQWQLDFRADPVFDAPLLADPYTYLGSLLVPELEQLNRIRFYTVGNLPLFFVDKDENGYSGLNTSDRGVLTTVGPNTSLLSKAQLLAHELAHFQNARNAQLKPRWLQEGMSEWTAERFLYRHFPRRAVYKFMRKLRFDRYFDGLKGGRDGFPLAAWGSDPSVLGYEKSLMFLDLLEARLGQDVLIAAFQQAVNDGLDTGGFRAFLEQKTGKDLSDLFRYWTDEGEPDTDADPNVLFKDADGDDLLAIDEELLGTDPALIDTDGDGYPDSEEYFRGMDPKVSPLPADGRPHLVNADDPDSSALFRLGGTPGAEQAWSLNPFTVAPEHTYALPQLLRPPYTVALQTVDDGHAGTVETAARDLWVKGVKQTVTLAADHILPPVDVLTHTVYRSDTSPAASNLALADTQGDLPAYLAAYDITDTSAEDTGSELRVTIQTVAKPDAFGEYGDYMIAFDNLTWNGGLPVSTHRFAVAMTAGAPYWHVYTSSTDTSALMAEGIRFAFGDTLTVAVDLAQLADWEADPGEHLVCISTQLELEGQNRFKDNAGCLTLTSSGFTRQAATAPDRFGLTTQRLDVFVSPAAGATARGQGLLSLGLSALGEFEHVLGRPLWERSSWPVHVSYLGSGAGTAGSATARTGAYLALDASLEGYRLDYLFVEQLARLATVDLLDKAGNTPFWLQEIYIQWLTASAMYRIYPTSDVHAFHKGRIGDYLCYVNGGCSSYFSSDVKLLDWNVDTDKVKSSTGSVKSLIFVLELDALIGADNMARVMGVYANDIPDSETLKALCKGYAPGQAAGIDALWTELVDGIDTSAIKASLQDGDHDGLYLFEEQKLGYSDAVDEGYLP